MASLQELRNERLQKLHLLKNYGMNPYPLSVARDMSLADAKTNFTELEAGAKEASLSGRIVAIRGQGAILFVVLQDGKDRFQTVFKKDEIEESLFKLFADAADMGDFISVTGTFFTTARGEQSLLVKTWTMATKALLPLPEKWHGLQDVEETYRKRYLDLLSDESTFSRFETRSKIIKYIREYFYNKNFLEIETPILQNQAGGAMAQTFDTHHNDYDMDMVMRISLELEHKMMMAAGYNRIYEIGKNFRNEGSDPTHIQEFSMIEWYAAYETLETNMKWTEDLLRGLARDVVGKMIFQVLDKEGNKVEVDFGGVWPKVRFGDLLQKNAGIDMADISIKDLRTEAKKWGMSEDEVAKTGRANLLDHIYKKSSRNAIIQPTFVLDYPSELKPLAQQNGDGTAKVAQLIIAGAEITNQYAELVNPIVQRALLEDQSKAKAGGDDEAMEVDERFLTAMEHGMPPMTGFGMGIDRLVALLTEQDNLRDVIFFPIMRPKE
jgi:lysyl-tRNA synthetase class 2